ncbi:MAG TPA: kelch repeat-containing protein [Candidatus Methanoperedens sp.]
MKLIKFTSLAGVILLGVILLLVNFVSIDQKYSNNSLEGNSTFYHVENNQCTNKGFLSNDVKPPSTSYWTFDGCTKDQNRTSANDGTFLALRWIRLNSSIRADQAGFEQLNGVLYQVGGLGFSANVINSTYSYNITADIWTKLRDAPIKIQSPVLRAVNGKLYLIGGYDTARYFNTTYMYDPDGNNWTQKADMSIGREDMASAVVGDEIYIFGGIDSAAGHHITNVIEVYNTTTDTWSRKSIMPNPRALGDYGASYNGKIYLVSGVHNMSKYPALIQDTTVDIYDPANDTWNTGANITQGLAYKEVEPIKDTLYAMGGSITTNKDLNNLNYVYNITTNTWSQSDDLPTNRTAAGLASYNNEIYLLSGGTVSFWKYIPYMVNISSNTVAGKYGTAFSFDGIKDYINIGDNVNKLTSGGTISFWAKNWSNGTVISRDNGNDNMGDGGFILRTAGNDQAYFRTNYGQTTLSGSNYRLQDGIFHHYLLTFDSTGRQYYRDGVAFGSKDATNTQLPGSTANTTWIGRSYSIFLKAEAIDDMRIYDYAVNASQAKWINNENKNINSNIQSNYHESIGNAEFYFYLNYLLYLLIFLGAASLVLYAKKLENVDIHKFNRINKLISYTFLGLLLMMAMESMSSENVPELIKIGMLIAGIVLGTGLFWLNGDKIEYIEKETRQEEKEEKKREIKFEVMHPRINRIWGFRRVGRWMYKDGWIYSLIFALLIINAFFLRYDNLGMLPLQNDEFLTADAVRSILSGNLSATDFISGTDEFLSPKFYSRAWPYSLSVAVLVRFLGSEYPYSYVSLRLASVIVGTVTLIFLYLLLRFYRINKVVSLATIYLFSVFYIFVYHSRSARMYSLFLFLYFVNFILIYDLLENIRLSNESYISDFKKHFIKIAIIISIFILTIIVHNNILTLVIPFYFISVYYCKSNDKLKTLFIIGSLCIFMIFFGYYFGLSKFLPSWYFNINNEINYKFFIYSYSYLQGKEITLIFFISVLFLIISGKYYINKLLRFCYLVFISIILFFIFLANGVTFHDPRYIIFLYPFYGFIIIYSLYYYAKITFFNKKIISILFFIILFILIASKIQIATVCTSNSLIECPISHQTKVFSIDRWNYNYDEIYSSIRDFINKDDIIIGRSIYPYYLEKYGIKNNYFILVNKTKISIPDMKEGNIIFIVHPELVYRTQDIEPNNQIYINLYKNNKKILLYESNDKKTKIYKINISRQ